MLARPELRPEVQAEVDALRRTREILEHGWCQDKFRIGDRYCMLGAGIKAVTGIEPPESGWISQPWRFPARIVDRVASLLDFDSSEDVTRFNDRRADQEMVLARVDKAIERRIRGG